MSEIKMNLNIKSTLNENIDVRTYVHWLGLQIVTLINKWNYIRNEIIYYNFSVSLVKAVFKRH